MALPSPPLAYKGAGLGETQLASVSGHRPWDLFILNWQHGRVAPYWAQCDVFRFWGYRLGEEAGVVTRREFELLSQRLLPLCLATCVILGKLLNLSESQFFQL